VRNVPARHATLPGGAFASAAALAVGLLGVTACGGSSTSATVNPTAPQVVTVCKPSAKTLVALGAHVAPSALTATSETGNNGAPECRLTASGVRVVVNVDSSPQPYARLERAIVEGGQQFGAKRTFSPPETISHLGLDASWFPGLDELLTSDGRVLLRIDVHAPQISVPARRSLATALARVYLGPNDAAAAKGPAPSG
jgi:hypothetical protein